MGLIQQSTRSGMVECHAWGRVNNQPKISETSKGNVAHFFLVYRREYENGKPNYLSISCEMWGDDAEYCRYLEKGDYVMVDGRLEKNDYNGQSSYKIVVEQIFCKQSLQSLASASCQDDALIAEDYNNDSDGGYYA